MSEDSPLTYNSYMVLYWYNSYAYFNKTFVFILYKGNQSYMNEFSSIYQASEDLMDHCVLAETNGNFQEAIRHCSQAIGTDIDGKTLL